MKKKNLNPERLVNVPFNKTQCGVDFYINTGHSSEICGVLTENPTFKTDFFEFFFFRKANGFLVLNNKRIALHDDMALLLSPHQQQEWHVEEEALDYTFLIFQEEFINNFLSDKYFMYRLQYCYQHNYPTSFDMNAEDMRPFFHLLKQMKKELREPIADSYHMIVACLYQFLLVLNRFYAKLFNLPFTPPLNNYAYQYKELLEKHIAEKTHVSDYAEMMNISRISLNKAVMREFGLSAVHLLKQRLLQEVKSDLLFSGLTVKEIAYRLHFSEANHLMRFFKQMTGQTISEFISSIK